MSRRRLVFVAILSLFLISCGPAMPVLSSSCPVAMELLQDGILPVRPTAPATNNDLLDYALTMNEQAKAQNIRNAELRRQLSKCE